MPGRGAAGQRVPAVALVDVGGSTTKADVAGTDGRRWGTASAPTPSRVPAPGRVESDAGALVSTATDVLRDAVAAARSTVPDLDVLGVVVASLRQGFVLDDGERAVGPAVPNSDARGASHAADASGRYATTGHWPAPQLTLPKLLHLREEEPERWAAATGLLFYADHMVWRWTGARATEGAYACAGGMADVAARAWATDLLDDLGVPTAWLAPWVEAGDRVGGLTADVAERLGLPAGTPVHAGSGDTQLAALGAGGLADGVVTVVVGSSTPVQAATRRPVLGDPREHPWVSTHAARDRWALETNAGYPGAWQAWAARELLPVDDGAGAPDRGGAADPAGPRPPGGSPPGARGLVAVTGSPEWSNAAWSSGAPVALTGLRLEHTSTDVARALAEAHAFAVRGNLEDLARVVGAPAREVRLSGGRGAAALAPLLADALGRDVLLPPRGAPDAAVALVTGTAPQHDPPHVVHPDPGAVAATDEAYAAWFDAVAARP